MGNKQPFLLTLIFHILVLLLIYKGASSTVTTKKAENSKNSARRRPNFLIFNEKDVLTPNYSKELDCITPPIYFYDVTNRLITSLEVACKGTFLLINSYGELKVKLTDEIFNVNDYKVTKQLYFDYNVDSSTYILKVYNTLDDIQHKPDYLLDVNFEEIPADYNTHKDGNYLNWITGAELLGVNTISNSMVELPDYSSCQEGNKSEVNIPVNEMVFLIFIIRTNFIGIQNTYFAAFPIFFLSYIIYDVKKPLLNIKFYQMGSECTEIYDIKRGIHHYKGLKLKTNKIHGEKILTSESFYELEKLVKNRFENFKVQLGLNRDFGIVDDLASVNAIGKAEILSKPDNLNDSLEHNGQGPDHVKASFTITTE